MRFAPLLIGLIFVPLFFFGQASNPDRGVVFNDSIVPRVDIFINADTLAWIYDHVDSNEEFHATFIFSGDGSSDTVNNIGFRLRGNTSRQSAKKSFKVSFNTFEHGRKWHGLQKLNLNGEHNDPSIIRSKLCWDLLLGFNVPSARSNHVELYINNNYYGLYMNVEHIDEVFAKSRFGNNNGNLYKCLWPADLDFLGNNPENYKLMMGSRRVYDLKTNTPVDDYSDIAHFIDVLNNSTDEDFACEIERVFNIQDYLKIIAVDVFTGNWDGYIYNKNNFYLYHNTKTEKFEYINYDLDNTFGIDWMDRDWGTRNIYDWQQHGDQHRLLYSRVMENQELRDQFSYYLGQLLNEVISLNAYIDRINYFKNRNAPYVANDPYYPLDYGFTPDDYLTSFDDALGMHVKYGLIPFVNTRWQSASEQLENNNGFPIIKQIENNLIQAGDDLWVSALILGCQPLSDAQIKYSINGGSLQESILFDDGNHHDGQAGDNIFGGAIQNIEINTSLLYQVEATDTLGLVSLKPCVPVELNYYPSTQPALFINEFMASNDSTIADEAGEYDDWVEIYNGDTENIVLGGKYLSDNASLPNKWQMPDIILQPGDFILFWLDNDEGQGSRHANFKLSASGEFIGIFDSESTGFFVLDSLTYSPQTSDISWGRSEDGGLGWMFFNSATPGYSNVVGAVNPSDDLQSAILLTPNPVTHGILYFNQAYGGTIYSVTGKPVKQFNKRRNLDVSPLLPGIYFLTTTDHQSSKFIIQ